MGRRFGFKKKIANTIVLSVIGFSFFLFAYSNGITGRTTSGCSCHGSAASSAVTVAIAGPDTLAPGQQGSYTLTITGGPLAAGGCDISTSGGTLLNANSDLQVISGELTQTTPKLVSGGAVAFSFLYTAPATLGNQTLSATGLSVNNTGGKGGDSWNKNTFTITVANVTSVDESTSSPNSFELSQNYPNPFNPSTLIKYQLPENSNVSLRIYNSIGKEVAQLVNGNIAAGVHEVYFNAAHLSSGVYYYVIRAGNNFVQTRKMILLK